MSTDTNLPSILGTAQTRTSYVASTVRAQARSVTVLSGPVPGWSSPAAKRFQHDLALAADAVSDQADTIDALASALAGAKASAELRIHQDQLAAQAAARLAAQKAAAAKAAAATTAKDRR